MPSWQSLLMRYGKTLLRSRSVQEFVNQSKRIVYSQQWKAQQAKLNSYAQRMTNAAASMINTSIGSNNKNNNNKSNNNKSNNNGKSKQTPEFSSYQSLRLFVINNWYKHKSKIWGFLMVNFIGIMILFQVFWAVAQGMFRSEHPKIRETSSTQHAKTKDGSSNNKEQEHQHDNKSELSSREQKMYETKPKQSKANGSRKDDEDEDYFNKVKVKSSSSNVWGNHDGAVQDKYSTGISNNNFSSHSSAMNASNTNMSEGVADRQELNDYTWNAEGKNSGDDESKGTWRRWVSKKRENKDNHTAANGNMNEFDFTSERQSSSSVLNHNESRQFAFVDEDEFASSENTKSSYLYDDTATRHQELVNTKQKSRKQKRQSSDMSYHESNLNNNNNKNNSIDYLYNTNGGNNNINNSNSDTTHNMFENTSTPFLVKMDNETEFTSFIDRDEMTGGVKHVN